jgi:hypothetical protein
MAEAVTETVKAAGMFIKALRACMLLLQLAELPEINCSVLKGGDTYTSNGSRQQ